MLIQSPTDVKRVSELHAVIAPCEIWHLQNLRSIAEVQPATAGNDVTQRRRGACNDVDDVAQHLAIAIDMGLVGPAGDQIRLILDRGEDDAGAVADAAERHLASGAVCQVDRQKLRATSVERRRREIAVVR
jgi:hypothetical protein